MWKYAIKQVCLHIKKWETSEYDITLHSCIKSNTSWKILNLQKASKKGFRIQSSWISHFILNLIPRVSILYDSFDDNEGLLSCEHYRKGKRLEDIMLSPDRQFLIPKENKKHGFINA